MSDAGRQADYGIDAPGLRRAMFAVGLAGLVTAICAGLVAMRGAGVLAGIAPWVAGPAMLAGLYGLLMGGYMTHGSRVGKRRTRDRLLDLARAPWTGHEQVLDVGCGRGLMLIGAAQRLSDGQAIGVDIWRAADQSANTPDAALKNARLEAVSDRVRVETADARELPFADGTFDVVLSHWVVHNLPAREDQLRALDEMMRVLRPGGTLVLADIAHRAEYVAHLAACGMADLRVLSGGFGERLIGALSGGSFRPWAVIGRRRWFEIDA